MRQDCHVASLTCGCLLTRIGIIKVALAGSHLVMQSAGTPRHTGVAGEQRSEVQRSRMVWSTRSAFVAHDMTKISFRYSTTIGLGHGPCPKDCRSCATTSLNPCETARAAVSSGHDSAPTAAAGSRAEAACTHRLACAKDEARSAVALRPRLGEKLGRGCVALLARPGVQPFQCPQALALLLFLLGPRERRAPLRRHPGWPSQPATGSVRDGSVCSKRFPASRRSGDREGEQEKQTPVLPRRSWVLGGAWGARRRNRGGTGARCGTPAWATSAAVSLRRRRRRSSGS
jgi:hypothetical protein